MVKSIYPVQDFLAKTAKELEAMEEQVPLELVLWFWHSLTLSSRIIWIPLIPLLVFTTQDCAILCNLASIHQERQLLSTKHSLEAKSAS